jgi:hypothetical protein
MTQLHATTHPTCAERQVGKGIHGGDVGYDDAAHLALHDRSGRG